MAFRPVVAVRKIDGDAQVASLALPAVFTAPIRPDIVHFVHTRYDSQGAWRGMLGTCMERGGHGEENDVTKREEGRVWRA